MQDFYDQACSDLQNWIARNRTTAYSILVFLGFLIFVAPLMGGVGFFEATGHVGIPIAFVNWTWLIPGGIAWCLVAGALWFAGKRRHATVASAPLRLCRGCDARLPSGANYCDQCRMSVTAPTVRL